MGNPITDAFDNVDRHARGSVRQNDDELFPAKARAYIVCPQEFAQPLRESGTLISPLQREAWSKRN